MVLLKVGRLMSCGMLVAVCAGYAGAQETASAASVASADRAAATAAALPPPATEVAPKAPSVTCKGDQLTIAAENSTMSSVLTAVRACTGALIDVPESFGSERTYMKLGPAPAREVLESLLSSTEYNYVIELSETEPGKIHSVLLMARADDAEHKDGRPAPEAGDMQLTPARRAWLEMRRNARPAGGTGDDAQPADAEATAVAAAEAPRTVAAEASAPAEAKPEVVKADAMAAAGAAAAPSVPPDTASGNPSDATPNPGAGPDAAKPVSTTAVATAAETAAPADSSDASSASKEMQNRISTMQQLFEQRKQMIQGQGAVAKPQ